MGALLFGSPTVESRTDPTVSIEHKAKAAWSTTTHDRPIVAGSPRHSNDWVCGWISIEIQRRGNLAIFPAIARPRRDVSISCTLHNRIEMRSGCCETIKRDVGSPQRDDDQG
mmetsp:Transcript_36937/g.96734  ORF Transcript_36937/g.96734 Transcript_36937/m.96734 type:complete len:112 (-) Transcript_36937:24-359(-)